MRTSGGIAEMFRPVLRGGYIFIQAAFNHPGLFERQIPAGVDAHIDPKILSA